MTLRAAVFASGRGSNFQVLADSASRGSGASVAGGEGRRGSWEVTLLVTDRDDAAVLERAREREVSTAVVLPEPDPERFGARLLHHLEPAEVDMVLLAGYLKLVPPAVVQRYRGRILNLHPALLPGFGGSGMYGRRVHQAVLDSGARISGASVHFVDEEYDRGKILAQWPVPVLPEDTAELLQARVLEVEHLLYPAAVNVLARAISDGVDPTFIPASGRHFCTSPTLPVLP